MISAGKGLFSYQFGVVLARRQGSFADLEAFGQRRRTRRERFLGQAGAIVPWREWVALVGSHYPDGRRGRKPVGCERMPGTCLLQVWFHLSDEACEDAVLDSRAMQRFVGIDMMSEQVPDATTLPEFRHLLEGEGLGERMLAELVSILDELHESGLAYRVLFLDCDDDDLVKRYESVRRPHPLQGDRRLLDGIQEERELLKTLRTRSDILIDTSGYSVHDLARKIRALVADEGQSDIRLTVMSFGFKYGLPLDADNVVDVRFLPNPYWVSELRHLTGKDSPVANFVLNKAGGQGFVERYTALLTDILHGYTRELKPFVTIGIGCTGGKHRSVAIAEAISERLRAGGRAVRTIHRDLGRE